METEIEIGSPEACPHCHGVVPHDVLGNCPYEDHPWATPGARPFQDLTEGLKEAGIYPSRRGH